jgi:hypothetical protein
MIKIELGGKKYNIPSKFSEVNIKTYQELMLVEEEDEKEKVIHYLSVITGLKRNVVRRIDINDIIKLMDTFKFFDDNIQKLVEAVVINNNTYVFDQDLEAMNFDMFVDLEELTKDKETIINNLHLIMGVLYRPSKKKTFGDLKPMAYDSENVKERAEMFKKDMMMDKILGSLFFFINLNLEYTKDLEVYLMKEQKKVMKAELKKERQLRRQTRKNTMKNGDGF